MEQIKNLSLKKTIMLYLVIALTSSFFLSASIVGDAERLQESIWLKYIDIDKYVQVSTNMEEQYQYRLRISRISSYVMTDKDNQITETCDFLITWTPLILTTLSSGIAVFFFYRNKLKKPLDILESSSNNIASNRLDFHVQYDIKDEMGRLCTSFEHMRIQLEENNKHLWNTIEDQKTLKAAIAHDIRAPLSILKGYHEMLLEFIPEDRIDKEKLMEILLASEGQVQRLTEFVDTMKQLSSLENREVKYEIIHMKEFEKQLEHAAIMWTNSKNIEVKLIADPNILPTIQADSSILMEVYENLLMNAIRFTTNKIMISLYIINQKLQIRISDDGNGFKEEEIDLVTKAYYHNNPADDLTHSGLGLYICKLLCEKHGGEIILGNHKHGGACVKATFEIR